MSEAVNTRPKRRHSGSNTRKRNAQLKLNLLEAQSKAFEDLAQRDGFKNPQAWIMERLRPDLESVMDTESVPA
ncbi:Uncharacterised protein [Mycobacteroides abscessus subsp. abscessus]|uniref:hypothetical protein n=1 Tax=Mycobacteroides abscessus TaxID=36809 RepID=UPI0009297EC7|nr:hypothetical protein [Mycobacteroides abscessus]SIH20226.1 Uncharacterised protein [Mycobacteroides abscessus subsp. abscessus]